MPSGCSDHRRRFLRHVAVAGLTRDGQCRGYDAAPNPQPRPRPAPDVAAGRPGVAARLRTLSARKLRIQAPAREGAVVATPLNEVHGERYAVHRQFQPDAPG